MSIFNSIVMDEYIKTTDFKFDHLSLQEEKKLKIGLYNTLSFKVFAIKYELRFIRGVVLSLVTQLFKPRSSP